MRSKGRWGNLYKFWKDKCVCVCACVTEVETGRKRKGTNVAVAIFSKGAIVSRLGGKRERWRARQSQLSE